MKIHQNVHVKKNLPGKKAKEIIAKDHTYLSPALGRPYPLAVDRGKGVWIKDVDGNTFLDFVAGIAVLTVGHSHPEIIKAATDQMHKFTHVAGTDFYYEQQVKLARKLCSITPGRYVKQVFFTNSGTETVEAALKLARYYTKRPRFIAFIGAFHGRSLGSLSLNSSKTVHKRYFAPLVPETTHVPFAYCYRCIFNMTYPQCKLACVDYIEDVIFKKVVPPEEVAAIVAEPIQGEGGYVVPPKGYFQKLHKLCKKYNILLIMDEIQAGMGRTGKMFAIEHWNVVPDIICISKGIASGFPMGAMVARKSLHVWEPSAHSNTFGGNPVASVVALKTFELIDKLNLLKNAERVGKYIMKRLKEIQKKSPYIGDVRGKGLMIGIEIVKNKRTKQKSSTLASTIVNKCFRKGLILLTCGDTMIRMSPPLILTRKQAELGLDIIERVIRSLK